MAPRSPMHALHRAMAELTLGVVQSTRGRAARDREMGFRETQQQYQIAISGEVSELWSFAEVVVAFDYPFFYAPAQRDSDLDRPQFWCGGELFIEGGMLGTLSCVVTDWSLDESHGAVVGATVNIGVIAARVGSESSTTSTAFTGVAHLTFQGFAALSEAETGVTDSD